MSDFFREVDEEVRRDKAVVIWQKYQFWFLGVALLVVAATAAWRLYDHYYTQAAEAAGAQYQAALQLARDGKSAEAKAALDAMAKTAPAGYRSLARLRAVDELSSSDAGAAIKAYDALAEDPNFEATFQDVARLRAAILRVDQDGSKETETKLAPLAAASFPYHASIRELLALAALSREDFEAAGRWLDQIVIDPQSPPALRQRAQAFLALVRGGAPAAK